jgi:hypothetical protein
MREAIADLRENPPTEEQAEDATPLAEEFLERMGHYSASATTEELRSRWGRVLAAEVRRPGTFSGKVLRVVDELDAETAALFEQVCAHRVEGIIPTALVGELPYSDKTKLVLSGLIVEPGITGQLRYLTSIKDGNGQMLALVARGVGLVAIPLEAKIPNNASGHVITGKDRLGTPALLLTDAGGSVASILPDNQFSALTAYGEKLFKSLQTPWVRVYAADGDQFRLVSTLARQGARAPPQDQSSKG